MVLKKSSSCPQTKSFPLEKKSGLSTWPWPGRSSRSLSCLSINIYSHEYSFSSKQKTCGGISQFGFRFVQIFKAGSFLFFLVPSQQVQGHLDSDASRVIVWHVIHHGSATCIMTLRLQRASRNVIRGAPHLPKMTGKELFWQCKRQLREEDPDFSYRQTYKIRYSRMLIGFVQSVADVGGTLWLFVGLSFIGAWEDIKKLILNLYKLQYKIKRWNKQQICFTLYNMTSSWIRCEITSSAS